MASKPIISITNSEARTLKDCMQLHEYRFRRALAPKLERRPLRLGTWCHYALAHLYGDGGWVAALNELKATEWDALLDDEKAYYGDLPADAARLMESYAYYYRYDPWTLALPPETPFDVSINTENYVIRFRGRVDLVVKDSRGLLWVIDHKSSQRIPNADNFRTMDGQLTTYPWAIERQYKLPILGTIYNYLRTKPPTVPHQNQNGALSKAKIDTDELTFLRAMETYGLKPEDYPDQYEAARVGSDTFFYRARVPRDAQGTRSAMLDLINTAIAKESYRFPLRNITFRCEQCAMLDLCQAEYFGQDTADLLFMKYKTLPDPYAYLGFDKPDEF